MSDLERRQMVVMSDLRLLIAQAQMLMALMASDDSDTEGITAGECIQNGADSIRFLAEELMENV